MKEYGVKDYLKKLQKEVSEGEYCQEKAEKLNKWQKYHCDLCQQELNGDKQWSEHVATRKHKSRVCKKWKQDNPSAAPEKKQKKPKAEHTEEESLFAGLEDLDE